MRKLIGCHLCPVKLIMSDKKIFSFFLVFWQTQIQYDTFYNLHLMFMYVKLETFPFEKQFGSFIT